jgi:hypothetical protein
MNTLLHRSLETSPVARDSHEKEEYYTGFDAE